jgi:protein-L-isoaspartate(D-aspartate) O-methyltransferase
VGFSDLDDAANGRSPTAAITSEGEVSKTDDEVDAVGYTSTEAKLAPKTPNKANSDMIADLEKRGVIKRSNVKEAMLSTDRGDYAPSNSGKAAYEDSPLPIGMSATISAPHMHAHALDLLADRLVSGARVLDIGCGSGYVASCMARMVGAEGLVIGIDHLKPLVDLALENIRKTDGDLLDSGQLVVLHGDGWKGCPQDTLFDCIHVGAAAETIPTALMEQLNHGGRMVIPVGKQSQYFYQIDRKADGEYIKTQLMPVRYVPLAKTDLGAACFQLPSKPQQATQTVERQGENENVPASTCMEKPIEQELANFDAPASTVKGAVVVQPPDAQESLALTVKGAPSVQPSDARCRWCSDVCC